MDIMPWLEDLTHVHLHPDSFQKPQSHHSDRLEFIRFIELPFGHCELIVPIGIARYCWLDKPVDINIF